VQLHEINREFVRFLEDKLDASRDFEERAGLASLKGECWLRLVRNGRTGRKFVLIVRQRR
jgi:hypothetical protein